MQLQNTYVRRTQKWQRATAHVSGYFNVYYFIKTMLLCKILATMADANVQITAGSVTFREFSGDDVESDIEHLEQHLIAWELDGDDEVTKKKRKAILISSIGGETYRVLKDMCYPDTPASCTYDQLLTHLRSYYTPKKLAVAERYRFYNTKQKPGQSICEIATFLKKITSSRNFGNDLQTNLRDTGLSVDCNLRICS